MTRILIDARTATNGGGYTYLANLIPRLVRSRPGDEFRVLLGSGRLREALGAASNLDTELIEDARIREQLRFTFRETPRRARDWGADLLFSTSEYVPARACCPRIASFRNSNVFTRRHQGWPLFQRARLRTLRQLARISALTCERILFVSEDSARWIGERMGVPEARRAVVHHGVDPEAFRAEGAPRPHPRPYALAVSSVYRYKNYVRLIEAHAELARRHPETPDLVIIGDEHDAAYAARMREARARAGPAAAGIHLMGEVPYEDLRAWYAHASLAVFPSTLESFGHPLLEALASDTPLVASDIPVCREVAGPAALYADPHRPERIADAMEAALFDGDLRQRLVAAGRARAAEFSWERTATRLQTVFEAVLDERAGARHSRRVPV